MTEKLIEEARKVLDWYDEPHSMDEVLDVAIELASMLRRVLAVFEKAHAKEFDKSPERVTKTAHSLHVDPTDDEREALASTPYDPERHGKSMDITVHGILGDWPQAHKVVDALIEEGHFRRPVSPDPVKNGADSLRVAPGRGTAEALGFRAPARPTPSEPQGEPTRPLDPQPWVFVSDQVFGVRSATDEGPHGLSGAFHHFQPRANYEQDRSRYVEPQGEPSDAQVEAGARAMAEHQGAIWPDDLSAQEQTDFRDGSRAALRAAYETRGEGR